MEVGNRHYVTLQRTCSKDGWSSKVISYIKQIGVFSKVRNVNKEWKGEE